MLKGIWGYSSLNTAEPSPRLTHIKDSAHSLKRCQGSESLPISSPSADSSSLGIYKEISWTSDISMTVPKISLQQSSQSHTSSMDDLGLPDINKGKKKFNVSKSTRGSKTARGTSPQKTRESHIDLFSLLLLCVLGSISMHIKGPGFLELVTRNKKRSSDAFLIDSFCQEMPSWSTFSIAEMFRRLLASLSLSKEEDQTRFFDSLSKKDGKTLA